MFRPIFMESMKMRELQPRKWGSNRQNGDILPRGLNQPGDEKPENNQFFYVDIESGPRKIILLAQICPNPGAWKLDGLLLEMTKMWLPALQIRPVSLNILNIETAWEKLWRLKFEKGMFVSRHVNRTIWCIYKNLTTIMSHLALWSLKLANN